MDLTSNFFILFSGDGGSSVDHRPNKRKASEGLFGRVHHFVSFIDVDYQPCHGDATQDGAITISSKRRAVNHDHGYYAVPVEVPVDPLSSRDHRQLAVRHARRSVKRAVRRIVSKICRFIKKLFHYAIFQKFFHIFIHKWFMFYHICNLIIVPFHFYIYYINV